MQLVMMFHISSDAALHLIGISPPRGSPGAAILPATGIVSRSDSDLTEVSLSPPAFIALHFGLRLMPELLLTRLAWFSCYTHRWERKGYVGIQFSRFTEQLVFFCFCVYSFFTDLITALFKKIFKKTIIIKEIS